MKLLYTRKQFQGEMEKALAPLKQENESLRTKIAKKEFRYLEEGTQLAKELSECKSAIEEKDNLIHKQEEIIQKLVEDNKLYFGAKGGLTKQNNKLREELKKVKEELKKANKELSKRYIVKKVVPSMPRKKQVVGLKSGSVTSQIIKKVVEDNE